MDQPSLESTLADLPLPEIRFFPSIGSTNDEALRWIDAAAPDHALVVADEQTAGRGRFQRRWITPPGVGLAFSLVLRSPSFDPQLVSRLTGLGSLAIRIALQRKYALSSQIKWPNDILIDQRKVAGVLVEAHWIGDSLKAVVIGIGINIASESVSSLILPAKGLNFPATCLETALGHPVNRLEVLHAVLEDFFSWLPRLTSPDFIHEWEIGLAYRHQWVELSDGNDPRSSSHADTPHHIEAGKVIGLTSDGFLKLLTSDGKLVTAQVGEIHLKPISAGHASLPAD